MTLFGKNITISDAICYAHITWKLGKKSTVKTSLRVILPEEKVDIATDHGDNSTYMRKKKNFEDLRALNSGRIDK